MQQEKKDYNWTTRYRKLNYTGDVIITFEFQYGFIATYYTKTQLLIIISQYGITYKFEDVKTIDELHSLLCCVELTDNNYAKKSQN